MTSSRPVRIGITAHLEMVVPAEGEGSLHYVVSAPYVKAVRKAGAIPVLLALSANSATRTIAYVLVWRNAVHNREHRDHFYAPYTGQASAADFVNFYKDPLTLFEGDVPPLYRLGS